jgi:hypothetical protein
VHQSFHTSPGAAALDKRPSFHLHADTLHTHSTGILTTCNLTSLRAYKEFTFKQARSSSVTRWSSVRHRQSADCRQGISHDYFVSPAFAFCWKD